MNKGLVASLFGLGRSVLLDIADFHPHLRMGIERDILRLETLVEKHGEKVFLLFLPALGKVFDQALESGALDFAGIPLSRPINRNSKIPRLFQGMWKLFFSSDGCLKSNIVADDVRLMRTLLFAFKKFDLQCAPAATFSAIKEYYDVDQQLPIPSQQWDGQGSDLAIVRSRSLLDRLALSRGLDAGLPSDGDDAWLLSVAQSVGDRVSSLLGEYSPSQNRFRHGPGAVSDLRTGRGYKYLFPAWGPRLQYVFPASEFAFANLGLVDDVADESGGIPLIEGASKLVAVPKTAKGPRLIAAEPTSNQWCQQSVRSFLTDALKACVIGDSIDFSQQNLSGADALAASVSKSRATVDLSSASDRLSCWLVERLFRANFSLLSAFIASRTRYITNDIDKKSPKLYKLRKFASMGSALTFPVQSISFYILCVAAGLVTERAHVKNWKRYGRQVRVYGDDLIIPVSWMPALERLFELLHLKINRAKTFVKGNFRESCGTDAYNGVNVSPGQVRQVYSESALGTLIGLVDVSNNLYNKGFLRTASQLFSQVRPEIMKLIPYVSVGSESFGLQTASGFHTTARKRWNKDLQREEYQAFTVKPKQQGTQRHESYANLLQYFTEDPTTSELAHWESGVFAKPLQVISKRWVGLPV